MEVEITESKPTKLRRSFAAMVTSPIGSMPMYYESILGSSTSHIEPDKIGSFRKLNFHEKLAIIRFYYEYDPVASRVIDKIIELGITGLTLDRNDCDDTEYEIYNKAIPVFMQYLMDACLEYLLSGLIVPQVEWETYTPVELELSVNRQITLPKHIGLVNPDFIELQYEGFTNEIKVYYLVPEELKEFLQKKGGDDLDSYQEFVDQYPELAAKIMAGESKIYLDDQFIIRRRGKSYDPYPTPFLQAAIESLEFKRNLRKMDYAISARVISAIQMIRLGNDTYPLTEDDEDQLDALRNEMLWRNQPNNVERVFQLFGNHTLDINWVYPDTQAMLDKAKYESVNEDIFYALAFPRILISGETQRSATSQAEFAMFSPAETIKRIREDLLRYITLLISEIKKTNNLKHSTVPRFPEIRLFDIEKLAKVASQLYQANAISLTSLAKSADYNFDDEVVMKSKDQDLLNKYGLPETPAMPFSKNQTGNQEQNPEQKPDQNTDKKNTSKAKV